MQNSQPFIVTIAQPAPAHQTTLGDVIVSALAFTAAIVLFALVFGAVLGGLLSLWRRYHPAGDDNREMSISPLTAEQNQRRSSQVR